MNPTVKTSGKESRGPSTLSGAQQPPPHKSIYGRSLGDSINSNKRQMAIEEPGKNNPNEQERNSNLKKSKPVTIIKGKFENRQFQNK